MLRGIKSDDFHVLKTIIAFKSQNDKSTVQIYDEQIFRKIKIDTCFYVKSVMGYFLNTD